MIHIGSLHVAWSGPPHALPRTPLYTTRIRPAASSRLSKANANSGHVVSEGMTMDEIRTGYQNLTRGSSPRGLPIASARSSSSHACGRGNGTGGPAQLLMVLASSCRPLAGVRCGGGVPAIVAQEAGADPTRIAMGLGVSMRHLRRV